MDTRLIKANIALYKGERAETQRLITEFRDAGEQNNTYDAMVLWLEAQAQSKREERISLLNTLIQTVDANNAYAQMAKGYLDDEDYYWERIHQKRRWSVWQITLLVLVIGSMVIGGYYLLTRETSDDVSTVADVLPTVTPEWTPISPDHSQLLVSDSYTARYPDGILQLIAYENQSERVIDSRSLEQVTPVPGARFYALHIIFECREAICNNPPEATLNLRLEDERIVSVRDGVQIVGQGLLQPIALGRTTSGWVIFEIPVISRVNALIITSQDASGTNLFEPIIVELPE